MARLTRILAGLALVYGVSGCVFYAHEIPPQPERLVRPASAASAELSYEFRKLAPADIARFERALRIEDPLPAGAEKIEPFEVENRARFEAILRASTLFDAITPSIEPSADHLRVFLAEYPEHVIWWPISGLTLTIIPAWSRWNFELYAERTAGAGPRRVCHLHDSFKIVAWLPLLPFALIQWPSDSEQRVRGDLYRKMLQELGYAEPAAATAADTKGNR